MNVNQNESKLVAIFAQGVLYGAFFVMFILTYWTLVLRRPSGRRLNKTMLGVSFIMFVLATIHIITNLIRILQAFVGKRDTSKSYWNGLSEPTHVFGSATYFMQTLVGDGVALYRCYIVWGRRPVYIALPLLFFLGSIVTGTGMLVFFARIRQASIFSLRPWVVAFFSFTLATSTICTLMIATRIWFFTRNSFNGQPGGSLFPIVRIVLESGALYSGTLITLLVLFETESWFQYILVDSLTPIIGLVFSIIIVRVGLGITTDGPSPPTDSSSDDDHYMRTTDIFTRPSSQLPRLSRVSMPSSPSHHWPFQPYRPLGPVHQGQHNKSPKTSIFSFKRNRQGEEKGQGHYNLRSQLAQPSSYFRASEDMEIDMELEFEMDEARYRRPKPLPVALVVARSEQSFGR